MKSSKSWLEMTPQEFDRELRSMRPSPLFGQDSALYYVIHGIIILLGMIAILYSI
jgi:hypothetical protein